MTSFSLRWCLIFATCYSSGRGPDSGHEGQVYFRRLIERGVRSGGLRMALLLALFIGFVWTPSAYAQFSLGGGGQIIGQIVVEGTQRIDPETVRSFLTVSPGDVLGPQDLDDTLKSLFRTGLFADVVLRQEGSTLVVSVVENAVINRVAFEGNLRIDDETLQAEIQLRPRIVFTRTRVQSDVARLIELYRRSGRFAATVEPKIIELDQNRVDLVFEINEGPLTEVQRIAFVGNEAFSDSRLRRVIQTEESRFWRVLTTSDSYDPDRIAFDRELLRRFYLGEGYADFRVASVASELTPDREAFFITFTLNEGERYRFGHVTIESLIPDLVPEQLNDLVVGRTGDWYSNTSVEETIAALSEAAADLQFAFVDVTPRVTRNRQDRLINVTYQIGEGRRVFVERIDINGNLRTIDRVIRREMRLVEGDPFSASRLRESEARVRNLGFFSRVEVTNRPGSNPDQTIVDVAVAEQSTGELSIAGGVSSGEGPLVALSLTERNLLGRGQRLSFTASFSANTQEFDASFTEPYFLERDISAGVDIFRITRDNQDESSFDEFSIGFGLRVGYPLAPNLRQTVNYGLSERRIENVPDTASSFIRRQEGARITSAIGHRITYDRLNNRLDPTEGYFLTVGNQFAGLGGDVRYIDATTSGAVYYPVLDDVIFSLSGEAGVIFGLDQDVAINDRFFVGGSDLRGFESRGIGPRDGNGDSLGGNRFFTGTAEVDFPVGLPEEAGISGRVFTDIGYLSEIDDEPAAGERIDQSETVRVAVGLGVTWRSPFGPILLDYAFPIVRDDFDREQAFSFSFGTRF